MTQTGTQTETQPVKRILVVDDDADVVKLIVTLLTRFGYEVTAATNGAAAAESMKTPPLPDVMLLDLNLPDIHGVDFLKQMRARSKFASLPVIVLSAEVDPDHIRAALEAGADRYLTKMMIAPNLISTVNAVLRDGRRDSRSAQT